MFGNSTSPSQERNRTPAPDKIPYYEIALGDNVEVIVTTAVTTFVPSKIEIIPIAKKGDNPPVIAEIDTSTTPPAFTGGKLTFNFDAPSNKGISNIGFDVEGAALDDQIRDNGLAPVRSGPYSPLRGGKIPQDSPGFCR
jgi:hypothetical protein